MTATTRALMLVASHMGLCRPKGVLGQRRTSSPQEDNRPRLEAGPTATSGPDARRDEGGFQTKRRKGQAPQATAAEQDKADQ
jgi:hypothetical protein